MKLLFVTGKLPLSKLITWGLDEPVSHFAILFDDKLVFHSDMLGVRISWLDGFLKTHSIVHEIEHVLPLEEEEAIYKAVISKYDGKMYDYTGFAYFVWRGVLKKFFGKAIPDHNPWGAKKGFLCTEMAATLPDSIVPAEIKSKDLGIFSPYRLWLTLNPQ